MKIKGHKARLINYLKENGKITTLEAIRELGNTRLSEYIRQLREDGYVIQNVHKKGTNRYGEKVPYDEFVLIDCMVAENINHIPDLGGNL